MDTAMPTTQEGSSSTPRYLLDGPDIEKTLARGQLEMEARISKRIQDSQAMLCEMINGAAKAMEKKMDERLAAVEQNNANILRTLVQLIGQLGNIEKNLHDAKESPREVNRVEEGSGTAPVPTTIYQQGGTAAVRNAPITRNHNFNNGNRVQQNASGKATFVARNNGGGANHPRGGNSQVERQGRSVGHPELQALHRAQRAAYASHPTIGQQRGGEGIGTRENNQPIATQNRYTTKGDGIFTEDEDNGDESDSGDESADEEAAAAVTTKALPAIEEGGSGRETKAAIQTGEDPAMSSALAAMTAPPPAWVTGWVIGMDGRREPCILANQRKNTLLSTRQHTGQSAQPLSGGFGSGRRASSGRTSTSGFTAFTPLLPPLAATGRNMMPSERNVPFAFPKANAGRGRY